MENAYFPGNPFGANSLLQFFSVFVHCHFMNGLSIYFPLFVSFIFPLETCGGKLSFHAYMCVDLQKIENFVH